MTRWGLARWQSKGSESKVFYCSGFRVPKGGIQIQITSNYLSMSLKIPRDQNTTGLQACLETRAQKPGDIWRIETKQKNHSLGAHTFVMSFAPQTLHTHSFLTLVRLLIVCYSHNFTSFSFLCYNSLQILFISQAVCRWKRTTPSEVPVKLLPLLTNTQMHYSVF